MKKNDWIYLASVLVYTQLFYRQLEGLNFLLMNVVLLGGIAWKERSVLRNRNWWFAATGALVSATSVMIYGDAFSVWANFFSLLLVSSYSVKPGSSIIIAQLNAFCNTMIAGAWMIVDGLKRLQRRAPKEGGNGWKKFLIVLIAFVVVLIFFFLYRSSNVLFDRFAQKINLDFISIPWLVFTLVGAWVLYAFYYPHPLPKVDEWENALPLDLKSSEELSWFDKLMSLPSERFSGLVLLSLLNALLLVVNGLDALFLFGGSKLPQGVTYTEYVHQGVGALITSIVFAMAIILFYFRGRLNFDEKSGTLRFLAYCWIVQNAFMLFSTACRNNLYVGEYGLTYKRIGVYIYLLLTLIGLVTTAWKVMKKKTNVFLFRSNAWLFYAVMILGSTMNFDRMIAEFNTKPGVKADVDYLQELSFRAYPAQANYYAAKPGVFPQQLRNNIFVFVCRNRYIFDTHRWPSVVITANRTAGELSRFNSFGNSQSVFAMDCPIHSVAYIPGFANTTLFNLNHTQLESLGEIGRYKAVTTLLISDNDELHSLEGIEGLQNLERLVMTGTSVTDYSPLLKLPHLKQLATDSISNEWRAKLLQQFPSLELTFTSIR